MSVPFYGGGMLARYTFVVHVHPGGISTLENVGTEERIPVADLRTVGPQIERWVEELVRVSSETSQLEDAT